MRPSSQAPTLACTNPPAKPVYSSVLTQADCRLTSEEANDAKSMQNCTFRIRAERAFATSNSPPRALHRRQHPLHPCVAPDVTTLWRGCRVPGHFGSRHVPGHHARVHTLRPPLRMTSSGPARVESRSRHASWTLSLKLLERQPSSEHGDP